MASEFAKYNQKVLRKKAVMNPRALEVTPAAQEVQPAPSRPTPQRKRH